MKKELMEKIQCQDCKGTGTVVKAISPGIPAEVDCRICLGKGIVTPPPPCRLCGGKGMMMEDCEYCNGSGIEPLD